MTDNTVTINVLPDTAPRTLHKADLSREDYMDAGESREVVTDLAEATVVSSIATSGSTPHHYPVLDLDVPARLVPSSTPGHSHLYIDKSVPDEAYWRLCEALAVAGILEHGYVNASLDRGYTSVRLPWIKKEVSTDAPDPSPSPLGGSQPTKGQPALPRTGSPSRSAPLIRRLDLTPTACPTESTSVANRALPTP